MSESNLGWQSLDWLVEDLREIGAAEESGLLSQIPRLFGPELASFDEINSDQVYEVGASEAAGIVDAVGRILGARSRIGELLVRYIATHRDQFEKP